MDGGAILALNWLLLILVIVPFLTLLHELGHALAGYAVTRRPVRVFLGAPPHDWRVTLGPLQVAGKWTPTGYTGYARHDEDAATPRGHAAAALAGPAASLLCTLALSRWGYDLRGGPVWLASLVQTAAACAFLQLLCTAVPMRYPRWWPNYGGSYSDGHRAWRLLQEARASGGTAPG